MYVWLGGHERATELLQGAAQIHLRGGMAHLANGVDRYSRTALLNALVQSFSIHVTQPAGAVAWLSGIEHAGCVPVVALRKSRSLTLYSILHSDSADLNTSGSEETSAASSLSVLGNQHSALEVDRGSSVQRLRIAQSHVRAPQQFFERMQIEVW